ncbi:hypothetical protein [Thermoactinospora rubra]|uniref:hypothetical protein n=1 Tax=Thermoactinospora rubra TaxID=1088767 RepID=UPI000A0FFDE5|nr:hypothetical protein [Thermoactinospora rubra]
MLSAYPEIRDRIFQLARDKGLRVELAESSPRSSALLLLIWDQAHINIGRAILPTRHLNPDVIADLERKLEHIFGKDWLQ